MLKGILGLGDLLGSLYKDRSSIEIIVEKETNTISSKIAIKCVESFIKEATKNGLEKGFITMSLLDRYILLSSELNNSNEKESKQGLWFDYLTWHSNRSGEIRATRLILASIFSTTTIEESVVWLREKLEDNHFNLEEDSQDTEENEDDCKASCECDGCVDPFYVPNSEGVDELDKDDDHSVKPTPETK